MRVLPMNDRCYLIRRDLQFEEHDESGQKAVVFKDFSLPTGRFGAPSADLMILLPSGYPDCPPDMFYMMPWLKLVASNCYPNGANSPYEFLGRTWQRWSRHNNEWRPGVDGIWTMLKRVEAALECAV